MESAIYNFEFANPTRVVFGKGQIAKLPELIPKDKIVFMTYGGGSIKRNGVYDQVKKALEGYEVMEFGGIEANPDFDTLMKAVRIIKTLDMSRSSIVLACYAYTFFNPVIFSSLTAFHLLNYQ